MLFVVSPYYLIQELCHLDKKFIHAEIRHNFFNNNIINPYLQNLSDSMKVEVILTVTF